MQPVLERGSIDKPLTFDVGLIQLSFIPVYSPNTCNISVKLRRGFALQCFSFITVISFFVLINFGKKYLVWNKCRTGITVRKYFQFIWGNPIHVWEHSASLLKVKGGEDKISERDHGTLPS